MGMSAGNVVCVVVAIAFLLFHTFLFTNLSDRLHSALRRIDELELLLEKNNATGIEYEHKTITSSCVQGLRMRLDSELEDHTKRNTKVQRLSQKIQRLQKRVEKCIVHSSRNKRHVDSPRHRRSDICEEKKYALYTIWGVEKCPANSKTVTEGQMVTTDGSDYLCLSNAPEKPLLRPNKTYGRNLGSSVGLHGVTYGDIEDIVSLETVPPSGPKSKNNKTVPCALCARCGKSSSKMIIAIEKRVRKFYMQREYLGVLMSSKDSKKMICLSVDAREYKNTRIPYTTSSKFSRTDTVQIHPAELRCGSTFCEAHKSYKEGFRVKCMVVTF